MVRVLTAQLMWRDSEDIYHLGCELCLVLIYSGSLMLSQLLSLCVFLSLWTCSRGATFTKEGSTCTIRPSLPEVDDAIAIRQAFEVCKSDSKIVFIAETYNISSVMITTGLKNVQVEMPAYLQVRINSRVSSLLLLICSSSGAIISLTG